MREQQRWCYIHASKNPRPSPMGSSVILETPYEANKRCHMMEETSPGFQAIPR
jgi:hypothetical protein